MSGKMKTVLLLIMGLGVLLVVVGVVGAGPDTGETPYAGGCPYGYGGGYTSCGSGGCGGYDRNLTATQLDAIRKEKEAFYNATRDLRASIVEKQSALASELAQQSPDAARAGDLQSELNDLKGQLNQRYLQYVIAMKKITPDSGLSGGPKPGGGSGVAPCCATP